MMMILLLLSLGVVHEINVVNGDSIGDDADLFTLALTLQTSPDVDIGEDAFNQMFRDSPEHILKRECSSCGSTHRVIYYKRYTDLDSFNLYQYTFDWESTNNLLGDDFNLFSTLQDALADTNPWTYCNYDDDQIGMFRDCGPTGHVALEWTSRTRGGDAASFFIYTGAAIATLTTHSDNVGTHSISNDGGASWTDIGTEGKWKIAFSYDLTEVSANTKIRVSVSDNGVIGGFIATILYNGQQYSTTNPLGNGHWKLVSASDGDTALVYHEKTASPWGISTAEIASDAFWVWNKGTHNTLVFEFDFGSVLTSVQYQRVLPFQPTRDSVLTHIDMKDEMHFEMDIVVHSFPSEWANIFHCGGTDQVRMPGIWIQPQSATGMGFWSRFSNSGHWDYGVGTGESLVIGQRYHWELDITQGSFKVAVDGVVRHHATGLPAHPTPDNLVCYASDPWWDAADVTISNLLISDSSCSRIRRDWNLMDDEEQQLYIDGFSELINTGKIHQLSRDHADQFSGDAHRGHYFYPWHRQMIYMLESEIRNLGGKYSCFSLPYWDSSTGGSWWEAMNGGEDNSMGGPVTDWNCITSGPFSEDQYSTELGGCLMRSVNTGISLSSSSQIMDDIDRLTQYADFRSTTEGRHNTPHVVIGGNMVTGNAPDDPMFYLHHCFVDYWWALWQDCDDHAGETHSSSSTMFGGDVDHQMEVISTPFTVSDTLDITTMGDEGYVYEKGAFWDNARVHEMAGCGDDGWFVDGDEDDRRRRLQSATQTVEEQMWADCALQFAEEVDTRHCWTVSLCEYEQEQQDRVCVEPEHFEDCSGMTVDAETGDIDITLSALLAKEGLTECMKSTRTQYYDWAKLTRSLMSLCNGCYDPFCEQSAGLEARCLAPSEMASDGTSADEVSIASAMGNIPPNDGTGGQHKTATLTTYRDFADPVHKFPKYGTNPMYSDLEQSPNDDSWFESHDGTDGDYVFVLSSSTAWTLVAALCVVGIAVLAVILCRGRPKKRRYRPVDVFGSDTEPITDVEAAKLNGDEV